MAESSALRESAQVEIAAMPVSDSAITVIEEAPALAEVTEVTDAASPIVTATLVRSQIEVPLPVSEEVALAQNLLTQSETQSNAAPESQWALTAAPAEPAGKQYH